MNSKNQVASRSAGCSVEESDPREELLRRVLSSATFEKSPKLREFLLYVCRCALDNQPTAATEQQVGIYVFRRPPGYNPNEDNIVRSQARILRLKLEHHFAHEGKDERLVITIPKGRYLPAFERRFEESVASAIEQSAPKGVEQSAGQETPQPESVVAAKLQSRSNRLLVLLAVPAVVLVLVIVNLTVKSFREYHPVFAGSGSVHPDQPEVNASASGSMFAPATPGEKRIAAGRTGAPYIDIRGRRWEADEFYKGGMSQASPQDLYPPVPDANLFRTIRVGSSSDSLGLQEENKFRYDIPAAPGVYELRLYFADPIRHTEVKAGQDTQNLRHFQVNLNGRPLLTYFDAIADAGSAPVDIRAFKDVSPEPDGKVHLEFFHAPERPFVSAIELTPGTPGKLKPIRLSAHKSDIVDTEGTRWSGDNYYIGGGSESFASPEKGQSIPELYAVERFGNFSYAIPVPPGSYTIKIHFLESFFGTSLAGGLCRGAGCRVFDVTCNGVMLLHDFDIFQAAGGAFLPVVRTFHGLHPNGQDKLLISFSPSVNYAEVRAIEVIDEGR